MLTLSRWDIISTLYWQTTESVRDWTELEQTARRFLSLLATAACRVESADPFSLGVMKQFVQFRSAPTIRLHYRATGKSLSHNSRVIPHNIYYTEPLLAWQLYLVSTRVSRESLLNKRTRRRRRDCWKTLTWFLRDSVIWKEEEEETTEKHWPDFMIVCFDCWCLVHR